VIRMFVSFVVVKGKWEGLVIASGLMSFYVDKESTTLAYSSPLLPCLTSLSRV
jgi:hypothetical protein